jgi:hypothetical protein
MSPSIKLYALMWELELQCTRVHVRAHIAYMHARERVHAHIHTRVCTCMHVCARVHISDVDQVSTLLCA